MQPGITRSWPLLRGVLRSLREAEAWLVRLELAFKAERHTILPPWTARAVKAAVYSLPCPSMLRGALEARGGFKPVRLTPLQVDGNPLYQYRSSAPPLYLAEGKTAEASIAYLARSPEEAGGILLQAGAGCNGALPDPWSGLQASIVGVAFESLASALEKHPASRLEPGDTVEVRLVTPLLVSLGSLLGTGCPGDPIPGEEGLRNTYKLLVDPGIIAAVTLRTAIGVVLGDEVKGNLTPGVARRTVEWGVEELSYRLSPVTVLYGRNEPSGGDRGEYKLVRGVTGKMVFRVLTRQAAETLRVLLPLAENLGIGRSRSIGFGMVSSRILPPPGNT